MHVPCITILCRKGRFLDITITVISSQLLVKKMLPLLLFTKMKTTQPVRPNVQKKSSLKRN
uniref:Uncharacterized protein n=1 Tax=Anguilla anguilla TaxID=7936 RepID=A0A0E9TWT4_ANGAN